jgi:hypothetical protein
MYRNILSYYYAVIMCIIILPNSVHWMSFCQQADQILPNFPTLHKRLITQDLKHTAVDSTGDHKEHGFLVNDQRDAQILFYVFISTYNSLPVSSTQCS